VFSYIVEITGGFVFFKSLVPSILFALAPTAMASEFTNNSKKSVLSQAASDVSCQSLECQQKLAESKNSIVLNDNTIVLRGEINSSTVSKTISALMTHQGSTVNLFLSSPGGSVLDGAQLVQAIRSVNKKVVCVTDFSASMSFVILQACDERIVLESSILMQHVPSFGLRHQPQPNAIAFVDFLKQITNTIDVAQAKRMEITLERFRQLTRDDYWLFGREAVKAKAADRVAQAICSPELTNKEEKEKVSLFGGLISINVTWSKCPLITEPRSVEISRMVTLTAEQEKKLILEVTRLIDYKADARRILNEAMGVKKEID
jgi:ATP-dependent Clp protease protease subunit